MQMTFAFKPLLPVLISPSHPSLIIQPIGRSRSVVAISSSPPPPRLQLYFY